MIWDGCEGAMTTLIDRVREALEFKGHTINDRVNNDSHSKLLREHGAYVEHARTAKLVQALLKTAEYHFDDTYPDDSETLLKAALDEMEKK